jgi:hypothetical protein
MGRATSTLGPTNCGASILDRSAIGLLGSAEGRTGNSSVSSLRADTLLPGSATCSQADPSSEKTRTQEVILHEVWSQLSAPERQRFGHCFSFMLLKALGLRPCSAQEVES